MKQEEETTTTQITRHVISVWFTVTKVTRWALSPARVSSRCLFQLTTGLLTTISPESPTKKELLNEEILVIILKYGYAITVPACLLLLFQLSSPFH